MKAVVFHGIGVDRAIDAVGVDAVHPHGGPAAKQAEKEASEFAAEVSKTDLISRPENLMSLRVRQAVLTKRAYCGSLG